MKKVLFLDFDGVLNSHLWEIGPSYVQGPGPDLDPAACSLLNNTLMDIQDVEIVIISSYRDEYSLEQLKSFLAPHGLHTRVIAKTPSEPVSKADGITSYLKDNVGIRFVILDDDTLFDINHPYSSHQVKPSLFTGLLPNHIFEIKKLLS